MDQIAGKIFMFTGTLSITRDKAKELVKELGGTPGSSLSKNTDYLVVGEDQVGKSSKFQKAGLLGVTRIDEDFFWDMVKIAQEAPKLVLTEEEEEEAYTGLKGVITEETLLKVLFRLEIGIEEAHKKEYPPVEVMTYFSRENLERWLGAGGTVPKLSSRLCPYCGYTIPYSIDSCSWLCFRCNLFSDIGQAKGRHACVDWETLGIQTELGEYRRCKLCGNVKFVEKEDIDVKFDVAMNFVHSLEFCTQVAEFHSNVDIREDPVPKYNEEEREALYAKFDASRGRRIARKEVKGRARKEEVEKKIQAAIIRL